MGIKHRYFIIVVALFALLVLGVFYLMPDSQSPTSNDITDSTGVASSSQVVSGEVRMDFFLQLEEPSNLDVVVDESPILIQGMTRVDALVTVNDYVVEPDIDGRFQQSVTLMPGLNIVEIVASAASGEQEALVLGVGYIPR